MTLFLGVHDMGSPMSDEEMKASWESYKSACANHSCTPVRAHVNAGKGKGYCLTEAISSDDVQAAHDDAKVPVQEIVEVQVLE